MALQMRATTLYIDFSMSKEEEGSYEFPFDLFNGLATAGGVQLLNMTGKGAVPAYTEITDAEITVNGVDGSTFSCFAAAPNFLAESGG